MRYGLTPRIRLTLALLSVTLALLLAAYSLHLIPDAQREALASRRQTAESLAVQLSSPAMLRDAGAFADVLDALVARNEVIRSAAVRDASGEILIESGDHRSHWQARADGRSTTEFVRVPLFADGAEMGALELRFDPLPSPWTLTARGSMAALLLFMAVGGALGMFLVLRRASRTPDVAPLLRQKMGSIFDSLVEPVMMIDEAQRIVMANRTLAEVLGVSVHDLHGKAAQSLDWCTADTGDAPEELPWVRVMRLGAPETGQRLALRDAQGVLRSFSVNCTPLLDAAGVVHGAFASFADVRMLQGQGQEQAQSSPQLDPGFRDLAAQTLALATRHAWTSALLRIEFETAGVPAPHAADELRRRIAGLLRGTDLQQRMQDEFTAPGSDMAQPGVSLLSTSELGVLLPDMVDIESVGRVVRRIVNAIAAPVIIDGAESFNTCAIGISVAPADGTDLDTLMQRADEALRVARSARSGERYAFYQRSMTDALRRTAHGGGPQHADDSDSAVA